jgi:GNAT superfamily N-acetyltransferase
MSWSLDITESGPDDLPLLETLRDTIFGEFGHVSRSTLAAGWIGAQDLFILLARHEGQPIGFSCGYQRTPHSYYVNYMAIQREHRRRGVGRQFLGRMETFALSRGYERIEFNTQNKFRGMMCLGLKMGYRPIGLEKHDGTMNDLIIRFGKTFGRESIDQQLLTSIQNGDEIVGLTCQPSAVLNVILRSQAASTGTSGRFNG